jgi:multidrug resistance efflux pump
MKRRTYPVVLPLLALGMLGFGTYHMLHSARKFAVAENVPPAPPQRNPFSSAIAAAGLVEPRGETTAIGSPLAGVVLEVTVPATQVGRRVRAGDPLFRVDDRQWQSRLATYEANLRAAEAQSAKLLAEPRPEEIPPSTAKLKTEHWNVELLRDQFERGQKLVATKSISLEEQTGRELKLRVAEQQFVRVQSEHDLLLAGAWEPDKAIATSAVDQARAQIAEARTEIERAIVRAPVDANVLQVNVRPGEFVGAANGQALVVLGDLEHLQVRVDIDEHEIPRFRPGLQARAVPRSGRGQSWPLEFVRVEPMVIPKKALTGDNTERVDTRVLQVIYALPADCENLFVGQQLDVYIDLTSPSQ